MREGAGGPIVATTKRAIGAVVTERADDWLKVRLDEVWVYIDAVVITE